ncbi:SCO7613 C-terminal domain-containing membrane protein [Streptomyces albidoflavus]|uniref:SCO7613 C-terminal domain-containing membrane protein n=1 Tax=Streptomyces albidoflavus TaxID=1886 RepID=UPI00331E5F5B
MTPLPSSPAEELALLERELIWLDTRRVQLLRRRSWLKAALRAQSAGGWQPPHGGQPPQGAPGGWAHAPAAHPAPAVPSGSATGGPGAQHVLLILGGLLLAVAAIAFTLFSWGELGIAGRSVVLAGVTAGALGAPVLLLRRGLGATAESVGAVALLLTVLDAYALHAAVLPEADGAGYAAFASGVLAAGWAAYGVGVGRLRLPLPAAVVAGQFPLVLGAWAAGGSALVIGWALLVTAAGSVVVAARVPVLAVRATAWSGAGVTWAGGLLIGLGESVSASGPLDAAAPGVLLLGAAAVALRAVWRAPQEMAVTGGVVAGLAAVAGVGGVLRTEVPWSWAVVVYLVCGAALAPVARIAVVPRPVRGGVLGAAAGVTGVAVLAVLPSAAATLLGPAAVLTGLWAGAPDGTRELAAGAGAWPDALSVPVVLLVAAVLLGAVYASLVQEGREPAGWTGAAGAGAVGLVSAAVPVLLVSADVAYAAALVVDLLLVAGLLAAAVAVRRVPAAAGGTALWCAVAVAAHAGLLALAVEPATYAVFGLLLVLFAASAARSREAVARSLTLVLSVVCALVVASAAGASLELGAPRTAVLVLVVPAAVVVLGLWVRTPAVVVPLEAGAGFAALVALGLAVTDGAYLSLVLALCGVLAAATAVRPERRPGAGYLAAGLFATATWVRLVSAGVTHPEAYTLPVSVIACAVGLLRRRTDPEASSWTAYGPGLGVTLGPSLLALWSDPHWQRPLLLGAAALAVTVTGAVRRLQAPLLLGGGTLALVALHELAPHVAQVFDALPRWSVPALAGLLLLALGATYEQRLRDARRLREHLGRMR